MIQVPSFTLNRKLPKPRLNLPLLVPSASGCCVNAKSSSKGRSSLYNKHSTADTSYDRSKIQSVIEIYKERVIQQRADTELVIQKIDHLKDQQQKNNSRYTLQLNMMLCKRALDQANTKKVGKQRYGLKIVKKRNNPSAEYIKSLGKVEKKRCSSHTATPRESCFLPSIGNQDIEGRSKGDAKPFKKKVIRIESVRWQDIDDHLPKVASKYQQTSDYS